MTPLRILYVKESQNRPRASGHDVHGFHTMAALAARGHRVSLATIKPPTPAALEELPLERVYPLDGGDGRLSLGRWRRKFADYYGCEDRWAVALRRVVEDEKFDAVVLVARHLLPLLTVVRGPVRVWYVADDPAWHHLTRFRLRQRETWGELRAAAVNVLYERAFRGAVDRVWVVSPADRTAARLFAGVREVDLMPNGVDRHHYHPGPAPDLPGRCVFWGRLDFGPNVDALDWFLGRVWPAVTATYPAAGFDVFGFAPTPRVRELCSRPGVALHPDLPDLRAEVGRRPAVVLPFVTGGGIKNKLLEAAAMGLPVVCTKWALSGTKGRPPADVCRKPSEWVAALGRLWADPAHGRACGAKMRAWVTRHHTWDAAAAVAEGGIRRTLRGRG